MSKMENLQIQSGFSQNAVSKFGEQRITNLGDIDNAAVLSQVGNNTLSNFLMVSKVH